MDAEDRLVQWLNEILFAAVVEGFLFSSADIQLGERGLHAIVRGQSEARALLVAELKSVTYHDLCLQHHEYGWYARVVVDV
jgi:SHS2 domain-containing protein